MQLLDRYLQAVKKHLPAGRQDDIAAELSANLLAEVDEQEAALGRPLTLEEEEVVLRRHGHPLWVAARYRPQRSLIGPGLYPFYWYALKLALLFAAIGYLAVNTALLAASAAPAGPRILPTILGFIGVGWNTAAWVTLTFAFLEFALDKYRVRERQPSWRPRSLPPLEGGTRTRRPGLQALCQLIASLLFLAWLLAFPHFPYLVLGPAAFYLRSLPLEVSAACHAAYWSLLGLFFAQQILQFFRSFQPGHRRLHQVLALLLEAVGVIVLVLLLASRPFVSLLQGSPASPRNLEAAAAVNNFASVSIEIFLVASIAHLLWQGMRLRRANSHPPAAHPNASGVPY
jgi:hypothetical protein